MGSSFEYSYTRLDSRLRRSAPWKCLGTGEMTKPHEPFNLFQKCLETGETTISLEYGKCLETGEMTKSLENNDFSRDFVVSPVSRHFPYSRGFVISPVSRHFHRAERRRRKAYLNDDPT